MCRPPCRPLEQMNEILVRDKTGIADIQRRQFRSCLGHVITPLPSSLPRSLPFLILFLPQFRVVRRRHSYESSPSCFDSVRSSPSRVFFFGGILASTPLLSSRHLDFIQFAQFPALNENRFALLLRVPRVISRPWYVCM